MPSRGVISVILASLVGLAAVFWSADKIIKADQAAMRATPSGIVFQTWETYKTKFCLNGEWLEAKAERFDPNTAKERCHLTLYRQDELGQRKFLASGTRRPGSPPTWGDLFFENQLDHQKAEERLKLAYQRLCRPDCLVAQGTLQPP